MYGGLDSALLGQSGLKAEPAEPVSRAPQTHHARRWQLALATLLCATPILAFLGRKHTAADTARKRNDIIGGPRRGANVSIELDSGYGPVRSLRSSVATGYPWDYVVEPHRITTLSLRGVADTASIVWTIERNVSGTLLDEAIVGGTRTTHMFTAVGAEYVITAQQRAPSVARLEFGHVLHVHAVVRCKYVRRELRTLSTNDVARFLDAAQTLWKVREREGQLKYGSHYRDIHYFTRKHLTLSASQSLRQGSGPCSAGF